MDLGQGYTIGYYIVIIILIKVQSKNKICKALKSIFKYRIFNFIGNTLLEVKVWFFIISQLKVQTYVG